MSYFVYVLESLANGSCYVGCTQNIVARLKQHNDGRCRSTQGQRPWKIIYQELFKSRSKAAKREQFLKTGIGRQVLKKLIAV